MSERLLKLDDVRNIQTPENIAFLFHKLGYNASAQQLALDDLELPVRSAEAIWNAYLIADQGRGALQVLLFQLQAQEFGTPSIASSRMKAIAQSLCRRPTNFLLLGTKDYNQLMLVNPRKSFDADMNLKVNIRKLLIDRTSPTAYDRDRLEAIAVRDSDPQKLYEAQCEAFDVEKLTKQFYIGYEKLFSSVQKVIKQHNPHPYFDDPSRLHQFAQRLLGRVMFLYFLQKKEFLAGDRRFLTTQYQHMKCATDPEGTEFYSQVLEPLFFETLNKQRPNLDSRWGQIPYLNGGLFDWDYGPEIQDASGRATPGCIQLPNSLFDSGSAGGILSFFNGYNFTVSENVQGDEDVAVDPEMLGKVFENLLAKEERGQSGTFYTPRGIVHFMCVESLSRYLADQSGMSLDTIKQLMELDPNITDADLKQLLTREQARQLRRALEDVKVLDPAVGSGAFPLGMMQVILAVRQAIARREGMTVERGSLTISQWKRDIIANNLYGVDIKPEAIEIAKLRMWLSLVVDVPSIEDLDPLPNLDYKLMCGDSLISTIHGEQMIPDPTKTQQGMLAVTPVQQAIQPLLELQQQYYSSHYEERRILRQQIIKAEANVFRVATADRRQYWEGKRRKLEQDIKRMGKASRTQVKEQQLITQKLTELDKFAAGVERGERSLTFFQYHLHFNDVFQNKGGFDVVIGNPPYVRQERLSEEYKNDLKINFQELYKGTADIYTYFYGQGVDLLHPGGVLAFITSNKWFRANYGSNLRQYLAETCQVCSITDFGELPVFDAATFPMIFISQKGRTPDRLTLFTQVKTLELPYPDVQAIIREQGQALPLDALNGANWTITGAESAAYLRKMEVIGTPLGDYVQGRIYYGVKTGFNQAFVIDGVKRAELIAQDPKSAEIIKPLAVGNDVRKWRINSRDCWIIFTRRGIEIDRYPAIKEHLSQCKEELTPKQTGREEKGRKPGRYKWYEIQDDVAYYAAFEQPKIVYPVIVKEPRFTFNTTGAFTNDKAFIIPVADLYLLGILNSSPVWKYLKGICSTLGDADKGGRLELRAFYITKIPVPDATSTERKAITALVQKCLDAKGQGVAEWEAEINDRVAHLYGLTAEEMKIIRGE